MYPTKSTMDYMNEMNRLFPRNTDNDLFHSPWTPTSFNQSMARSSSSTDTSPETFPELAPRYDTTLPFGLLDTPNYTQGFERQPEFHFQETPCAVRQQRPIIGRKLMSSECRINESEDFLAQTPPNSQRNPMYELFPVSKLFELTPVKTNYANVSPRMAMGLQMADMPQSSNMSMTNLNISPRMPNMSPRIHDMTQRVPDLSPRKTPPMSSFSPRPQAFKEPITMASFRPNVTSKMCTFCRKNGETPLVYMTHMVKEKVGNKNVVTCPILRSHVCSTCGATGDNAHTITYCPILRSGNNGQPLQSTTITLKNTRVKSNGRRRF